MYETIGVGVDLRSGSRVDEGDGSATVAFYSLAALSVSGLINDNSDVLRNDFTTAALIVLIFTDVWIEDIFPTT